MRLLIYVSFFSCILLFACKNKKAKNTIVTDEHASNPINYINQDSIDFFNNLTGEYSGKFGANSIILNIRYVGERCVVGFNTVKDLRRNVYGHYEETDSGYTIFLKEPGDHEFDGEFQIFISTKVKGKVNGIWKPYNSSKLNTKYFTLHKLSYYNPDMPQYDTDTLKALTFTDFYMDIKDDKQREKNYILTFSKNGQVAWKYYDDFDNDKAQMKIIKGNWNTENSLIHIRLPYEDVFKSSDIYASIKFSGTEYMNEETNEKEIEFDEIDLFMGDTIKFYSVWMP